MWYAIDNDGCRFYNEMPALWKIYGSDFWLGQSFVFNLLDWNQNQDKLVSCSGRVWIIDTKYENQTNFARLYCGTNLLTKVNPILPDSCLTLWGNQSKSKLDVDLYFVKFKKIAWLKYGVLES